MSSQKCYSYIAYIHVHVNVHVQRISENYFMRRVRLVKYIKFYNKIMALRVAQYLKNVTQVAMELSTYRVKLAAELGKRFQVLYMYIHCTCRPFNRNFGSLVVQAD